MLFGFDVLKRFMHLEVWTSPSFLEIVGILKHDDKEISEIGFLFSSHSKDKKQSLKGIIL